MKVNRSVKVEEEEEVDEEEDKPDDKKEDVTNDNNLGSREIVRNMPDYYESSDDEDVPPARTGCCCSGAGKCLFCKKMRGCTCEGQGTCRLCEMDQEKLEEEESDDDIEIIEDVEESHNESLRELSTTELFLMTGEVIRPPSQTEDDIISVDDFIDQVDPPPARGRGRGRGRGRASIMRPPGPTVTNLRPRFAAPSGPRLRPASH